MFFKSRKSDEIPLPPPPPGLRSLVIAVLFPAFVVIYEWVEKICANSLFDPMPNAITAVLVATVPVINLLTWRFLRQERMERLAVVRFLNGCAVGIAGFYALIFLPVMPLALVGIFMMGLGLLPLAPYFAFHFSVTWGLHLRRLASEHPHAAAPPFMTPLGGILAVLFLFILADLPVALTHVGVGLAMDPSHGRSVTGIRILRQIGEDTLLRNSYRTNRANKTIGPISWFTGHSLSVREARLLYFRVTGRAYNRVKTPFLAANSGFFMQERLDRRAELRESGELRLVKSRLDASLDGDGALGYLEWEMVLQNNGDRRAEGWMRMALPPGAVVSRATLWVNDVEREAVIAQREKAVSAYESVVSRSLDPLLVTSLGADRVEVKLFPVPPTGGQMRMRLGITAPLTLLDWQEGRLPLPRLLEDNFTREQPPRHALWLEARAPLSSPLPGLAAGTGKDGVHTLRGEIGNDDLLSAQAFVDLARDSGSRLSATPDPLDPEGRATIVQTLEMVPQPAVHTLVLLVDPSITAEPLRNTLPQALAAVAEGTPVGWVIAGDEPRESTPAPWNSARKAALVQVIQEMTFAGGQDNAPGLGRALEMVQASPDGAILWVHGHQPQLFMESLALLEQQAFHQPVRLVGVPVTPGANRIAEKEPPLLPMRVDLPMGSLEEELVRHLRTLSQGGQPIRALRSRRPEPLAEGLAGLHQTSRHLARLWAVEEVARLADREAAVQLAAAHRIITPLTGAVVLENDAQYAEHDLEAPALQPGSVPSIPEPEEWALLLVALLVLLFFFAQGRRRRVPV